VVPQLTSLPDGIIRHPAGEQQADFWDADGQLDLRLQAVEQMDIRQPIGVLQTDDPLARDVSLIARAVRHVEESSDPVAKYAPAGSNSSAAAS